MNAHPTAQLEMMSSSQRTPPTHKFSLFAHSMKTTPTGHLTLSKFVEKVKDGSWLNEVEACRDALRKEGKQAYDTSKKGKVPAVSLSAQLKHRRRDTTLEQKEAVHSGLLQLDFDAKDHPNMSVEVIRDIVTKAPFVRTCFVSLSGEGVKAVALCPASFETHSGSWLAADAHFKEKGLSLDSSTRDPTRLCFVSYDPDAYFCDDAVEIVPLEVSETVHTGEESNGTEDPAHARRVLEELASVYDRPEYPIWLNICSAVFDGVGVETGIELLEEYWPEEKEGEYRELAKSLRTFIPWDTLRSFGVNPEDPEELLALMPDMSDEQPAGEFTTVEAFPIIRAGLTDGISDTADFVENLLTDGGASVVYGPSNCGKSFWILDLAVSVATGNSFRGNMEVDQGAVIYVALEGSKGAKNRIEAMKREGKMPDDAPLFMCYAPVSLLEKEHAAKLAASIKIAAEESSLPCRLVILDTLARAMAGGDENSGKDMGAAVKVMDKIREETGAHVCLIHHCGKDEARGARGHSSLRAAIDTEIEITRPEGSRISTVRATKQRDLQAGDAMPFSLKVITLGMNRRGKPITSCVVQHENKDLATKPGKAGRKAKCTADEMLRYLPAASATEWQERVNEETGLEKTQFFEHKKTLENEGKIQREGVKGRIICRDQKTTMPELMNDS